MMENGIYYVLVSETGRWCEPMLLINTDPPSSSFEIYSQSSTDSHVTDLGLFEPKKRLIF